MRMEHSQGFSKEDANIFLPTEYSDTKYEGIFLPTPINSPTLWIPTECPTIQFNFDTNYPELVQSPQDMGSVHKSAPTSNAQASRSSDRQPVNQGFGDPYLHNFLHQLKEHRKTV